MSSRLVGRRRAPVRLVAVAAVALSVAGPCFAQVEQPSRKFGYVDSRGKIVVSPILGGAEAQDGHRWAVVRTGDRVDPGKYGFVDLLTGRMIEPRYDEAIDPASHSSNGPAIAPFSHGLEPVRVGAKWGYIDQAAGIVIPPQFERAWRFAPNGLAAAQAGKKSGYIDRSGRFVIDPIYDSAQSFVAEGCARVFVKPEWRSIDARGRPIAACDFVHGRAKPPGVSLRRVKLGEDRHQWQTVDPNTGRTIGVFPQKALMRASPNGLIAFMSPPPNRYGFVAPDGRVVVPAIYDRLGSFGPNGFAPFEMGGKAGFLDETGAVVIAARFEGASEFGENGLAPIKIGGRWGYVNASGQVVIPSRFEDARPFSANGLAAVRVPGAWGFIDHSGKFIIPPQFDAVQDFDNRQLARFEVDPEPITLPIQQFGRWVLETTIYPKPDYIVGPPQPRGEVKITMHSADRLVQWSLATEGWTLGAVTSTGRPPSRFIVSGVGHDFPEPGRVDTLFESLRAQLASGESRSEEFNVDGYLAELESARPDFVRAVEAMRQRSMDIFGKLTGPLCLTCVY